MKVSGDNPITKPAEDALGRERSARAFANQILSIDSSQGLVVGVLGAWGSGKTSFINLARGPLEGSGALILDFNPWMFSGAAELVTSFFVELSAQLRIRPGLSGLGDDLEEYGESFAGMGWLPVVGPWIERGRGANKLIAKILQRRREGVAGRRKKLIEALSAVPNPIVVVIDDIDRLTAAEIRDVFKLVRLTASFPNVIYIVAFDRVRVEKALADEGIPGRDYLEKILQLAVDIPAFPSQLLTSQVLTAIDRALDGIARTGPFDAQLWPDIFMDVIRPLVRNVRDVRRYAAAVHGTAGAVDGNIALQDLLALEAVRVFLPDAFSRIHGAVTALTGTASLGGSRAEDPHKQVIEALIAQAGSHDGVVRSLIERVFPAGARHLDSPTYGPEWKSRWLRERRVAHEDCLLLYLEGVAGEGFVAFLEAEQASELLVDRVALEFYLNSIDPLKLQDVISSLKIYEDRFTREQVVPASIVLLNLVPDIPQRPRGMFDLDNRLIVTRVVLRLLRTASDQYDTLQAVREILPELTTLTMKRELIDLVGYLDGVGHKLVPEESATALEANWRNEVRAASDDVLAQESELLRVLLRAKREGRSDEEPILLGNTPTVILAALKSASTETRSQAMGSRAVKRSPRLAWDALVEISGGEQGLADRLDVVRVSAPTGCEETLALAERYLAGWRPSEFGDEE